MITFRKKTPNQELVHTCVHFFNSSLVFTECLPGTVQAAQLLRVYVSYTLLESKLSAFFWKSNKVLNTHNINHSNLTTETFTYR